jgi:hypothetical protein
MMLYYPVYYVNCESLRAIKTDFGGEKTDVKQSGAVQTVTDAEKYIFNLMWNRIKQIYNIANTNGYTHPMFGSVRSR